MLAEINVYRKILRMNALKSLDTFSQREYKPRRSQQLVLSTTCIQSMPAEVLDSIASYVKGENLLRLSSSVPYYKYISEAISNLRFDAATARSPRKTYLSSVETVWPNFVWPNEIRQRNRQSYQRVALPIHKLHAAAVYSRILSKHGGSAHIDNWEGIENIFGALPAILTVSTQCVYSWHELDSFLFLIKNSKKTVRKLQLNFVNFQAAGRDTTSQTRAVKLLKSIPVRTLGITANLPVEIKQAVHLIPNLSYLEMNNPEDCNGIFLPKCMHLQEIV
ncbi:hypothetical protein HDU78_000232, partial [Chytriomyces hyalinus]